MTCGKNIPTPPTRCCSDSFGRVTGIIFLPTNNDIMCQSVRKRRSILELKQQGLNEESATRLLESTGYSFVGKYNPNTTSVKDTGNHNDYERPMHFYNANGEYDESLD